jgi:hypothetical protein
MARTKIYRTNQEAVMKAFGERVMKEARLNLGATKTIRYNDGTTKRRRNVSTGKLKDTISYVTSLSPHPALDFFFERYGTYLDEGVSGSKHKVPGGSRFSYSNKQPPRSAILKWMDDKVIRLRDPETNKFIRVTKQGKEQAAYNIARKIKMRGIPKTEWFSQPFRDEFAKLPDEFVEAFALDVEQFLKEVRPF